MPDALASALPDNTPRQRWMAQLALATRGELETAWAALTAPPAYTLLRRPETGLAMVRGRAGGTGFTARQPHLDDAPLGKQRQRLRCAHDLLPHRVAAFDREHQPLGKAVGTGGAADGIDRFADQQRLIT